jgi:hypothetical protein
MDGEECRSSFCLWRILRHVIFHSGFARWQGVNFDVQVPDDFFDWLSPN